VLLGGFMRSLLPLRRRILLAGFCWLLGLKLVGARPHADQVIWRMEEDGQSVDDQDHGEYTVGSESANPADGLSRSTMMLIETAAMEHPQKRRHPSSAPPTTPNRAAVASEEAARASLASAAAGAMAAAAAIREPAAAVAVMAATAAAGAALATAMAAAMAAEEGTSPEKIVLMGVAASASAAACASATAATAAVAFAVGELGCVSLLSPYGSPFPSLSSQPMACGSDRMATVLVLLQRGQRGYHCCQHCHSRRGLGSRLGRGGGC
jgi:hypothetical protein